MKETIIKYGTYGFILALVLFLLALSFGQNLDFSTQELIGYLTMIVCLSFVFIGIRNYRNERRGGNISFRRALLTGLLIAALTSLGIALADFIYLSWINPDFFEEYAAIMISEGYRGELPDYGNAFMAMIMFLTVMVIGLFISLLSALILQRR